jgi:hypothetical protein
MKFDKTFLHFSLFVLCFIISSYQSYSKDSQNEKTLEFEDVASPKISLKELLNGYRGVYAKTKIEVFNYIRFRKKKKL